MPDPTLWAIAWHRKWATFYHRKACALRDMGWSFGDRVWLDKASYYQRVASHHYAAAMQRLVSE